MKARLATGLLLAAAVVALTLGSPAWLFAVLALVVMLAALVEWSRLGANSTAALAGVAAGMAAVAALLFRTPETLVLPCLAGLVFWVYQGFAMAKGAPARHPDNRGARDKPALGGLSGLLRGGFILLFAWGALAWMRIEQGAAMTLAMLLVVWSADTFAYFTGKRFGRRKLAPSISPGKTVEGVAGGLAGAGGVALALAVFVLELDALGTSLWLLASLTGAVFGVVGDLYESRLKRRAGVKDSGALLPGHGGVLDRIDGLMAATPVFASVWRLAA